MFENEIYFEQVRVVSFTYLQNIVSCFVSLFALFKLTYLNIMCVNASSTRIVMLLHIRCALGRSRRPSSLVVKT